jgi:UDP-N-acetylmuramoylalanine--D-glutamate ligase
VREKDGVKWYNDSKGTNVGATLAALEGLGKITPGKIILIAGGVGKGADFTPLKPAVEQYVRKVLLIGVAAKALSQILPHSRIINQLDLAVKQAAKIAKPGDAVLLSPACASFDMFKDYVHRGEVFIRCVQELAE